MLEPPWRDPTTEPPEEYEEVIVTTETGRVTSSRFYKGRFTTYTPIIAWQPLPPPAKVQKESKPIKVEEPVKQASKKKAAAKSVAKRKSVIS